MVCRPAGVAGRPGWTPLTPLAALDRFYCSHRRCTAETSQLLASSTTQATQALQGPCRAVQQLRSAVKLAPAQLPAGCKASNNPAGPPKAAAVAKMGGGSGKSRIPPVPRRRGNSKERQEQQQQQGTAAADNSTPFDLAKKLRGAVQAKDMKALAKLFQRSEVAEMDDRRCVYVYVRNPHHQWSAPCLQ